jgi:uncharacterized membrane protein
VGKGRVEAFSDAVIAIIMTIMVLELRAPLAAGFEALIPLVPRFLSYGLSFVFLGIYWNSHHHLFQAVQRVNGAVLWANLHLLFWLSLIPFVTGWAGENAGAGGPVALYGVVLLLAAVAYFLLVRSLLLLHGKSSQIAIALGGGRKEKVSVAMYAAAIPLALVGPLLAWSLYVIVALVWLVPDRRIERAITP